MRADDMTSGRARGPILPVVACAVLLTAGLLLLLASLVLHVATKRTFGLVTEAGEVLCVAGVAFGIAILTLYTLGKVVTGRRRVGRNDGDYSPIDDPRSPVREGVRPPARGGNGRPVYPSSGPGYPAAPREFGYGSSAAPDPRAGHAPGYGYPREDARHPENGRFREDTRSREDARFRAEPRSREDARFRAEPRSREEARFREDARLYEAPRGREETRLQTDGTQRQDQRPRGNARPPSSGVRQPAPNRHGAHQQGPNQPGSQGQGVPRSASRRAAPLDPTGVYSPGGLIGPPRDVRAEAPHTPGHEFDSAAPVARDAYPGTDDAEYAEVVHAERTHRPASQPPKPQPPKPQGSKPQGQQPPAGEPAPEVFVYRDLDDPAATTPGRPDAGQETRGPFEPLVKSGDTPPPPSPRDEIPDERPDLETRSLDKIKDLYATAEAIGDDNVDRHFDDLMRRQRELITEYFKETRSEPGDQTAVGS